MNLIKKWLAVGIILLFIGVAVAPSINFNVVKASTDKDLVEVTTQACGIQGYGDTTVKLTRQQYQDLEQYLVEFRARLNQTSTREEAVPIFKEAVVELDKYGLLPKGMSVERAQRLVIGDFLPTGFSNQISNGFHRNQINSSINGVDSNYFCLMFGYTNSIASRFIVSKIASFSYSLGGFLWDLFKKFHWLFLDRLANIFSEIAFIIANFQFIRNNIFPFFLATNIYFSPYYGSIASIGILGAKKWDGTITGGFPDHWVLNDINLGVIGFTGIHFANYVYSHFHPFFIGSAIAVKIILEP